MSSVPDTRCVLAMLGTRTEHLPFSHLIICHASVEAVSVSAQVRALTHHMLHTRTHDGACDLTFEDNLVSRVPADCKRNPISGPSFGQWAPWGCIGGLALGVWPWSPGVSAFCNDAF